MEASYKVLYHEIGISFKCALCDLEIRGSPILDGDHPFCCHGCHAVFQILSAKKALTNPLEHPVFRQAIQAGIISNPALLEEIRKKTAENRGYESEKIHLEIREMWCPSCAEIIKLVLLREGGVVQCSVDYATDLASIEYAPRVLSKERLSTIIRSLGYEPVLLDEAGATPASRMLSLRFGLSAFLALNVMMFAYPLYATYFSYDEQQAGPLFAWLSFWASLPVVTWCAYPIYRRFWASLKVGLFGMETLVVIGVSAAFGLSLYELMNGGIYVYFDSLTVIITFVLLGKMIEAKAKRSTKQVLTRLTQSLPKRGRRLEGDFVPIKEIQKGDFLVCVTGEKIVLDGIVKEGDGFADESLMTGESIPVEKKVGSQLIAGSILTQGRIIYETISNGHDSTLKQIVGMVEQGMGSKTAYIRAVDPVIRWFVPVVIVVALLTALFLPDPVLRALSVLLISCPCAIGIAAPLAESHLVNAMAHLGAIVRNRGALRLFGKETIFAFDKTGTITQGRFDVLQGLESLTQEELSILKGLSSQSIHPIAAAISRSLNTPPVPFNHIEEIAGKGLQGRYNGKDYKLGSALFMGKTDASQNHLGTTVFFSNSEQILAEIHLGDQLKEGANDLIASLAPTKTLLLSGDTHSAVTAVANSCGFTTYASSCSPLQKREMIESLTSKGETVAFLGDGINDALALTAAHIGISVVSAADISIQVSDILLTTDKLDVIPKIRSLACRGRRIVLQNLFWAFFYNIIGIALALSGHLTPIYAAAAMVLSSLFVLLNAKRVS
jgi:heavy metal translocating P-type ATPase